MDLINGIINVFTPPNLLYSFLGCVLGTLVGVLPGLGPSSTIAILLPLTTYLDPTGSIIMLAGIYYGAAYGGSTTSILVNIPGEPSTVATCFDGFPMTKQGRAGEALWIAAVGSFIAGTVGTLALSFIGPGVARHALKFGPPEYFGLLFFSLTAIISLSGPSLIRGVGAGLAGVLLATVGIDPLTATPRFNFGTTALMRGFELIPVTIGLFGIGEIFLSAEAGIGKIYEGQLGRMMPRGEDLKNGLLASIRGTLVGFPLGLLPGMMPALTSFLSYDLEKRISKHPEKFGTGMIEGVAGPESANNATAQAAFLPLMVLGIPTGPTMAIILGALMIYGLQPGPVLFQTNKLFIWTVIGSMYIGNVILLLLNLPLVGLWARLSLIPYKYLAPIILGICVVGAYAPRNTLFDVWVAIGAGVVGYMMKKTGWPVAPLILGFILGPLFEQALRQSLSMSGPVFLFHRPLALFFFLLSIVILGVSWKYLKRIPKVILEDDSGP
ncbi:MAG: tripartite tricarboxylate transporter permease [Deltaproteobacteria bacterium]|nr:tripartite tricarboxylate transporter permease [Deltaproteobacteria bacterium]